MLSNCRMGGKRFSKFTLSPDFLGTIPEIRQPHVSKGSIDFIRLAKMSQPFPSGETDKLARNGSAARKKNTKEHKDA